MSDDANATATQAPNGRMVWIDLEMTGLDPQTDEVVEIAVVVTEADLTEIDEGLSIVIKPNDAPLAALAFVVGAIHRGWVFSAETPPATTLSDAESRVLEYVTSHVPEPRK
ncbi:MAG: exonuclease domain-containing protein, partial [Actinomycetota bacterium]|nr:exonuclease domain-containing protein [Actinomycetota bacterium]